MVPNFWPIVCMSICMSVSLPLLTYKAREGAWKIELANSGLALIHFSTNDFDLESMNLFSPSVMG